MARRGLTEPHVLTICDQFKRLDQMSEEEKNLSGPMTVIALVNGMIGGLILILPVMALESGWLMTLIVLLVTGFISYYSCFLCVLHTGDEVDMDVAMEKHFWNSRKVKIFYELCIFFNLMLLSVLYYELIVIQWIGLVPPHEYTPINPIINAVALLVLVFVIKFNDFGATLMAYGIISIITYLLFLTWAVGSEDMDHDHQQLRLFDGNGIDLAAALGQAFAIQSFFIPVLKKNNKPHKYKLYIIMAFMLGTVAYAYIAFMGSQGIVHREYVGDPKESKTIEGYFETGAWQVNIIEVIYLVHLYSVFPEFLLISKKRVFSIFLLEESEANTINWREVVYIVVTVGFCLGMALIGLSLRSLVEFNGAVIGFFFIYFFPVAIHFKCCFTKHTHGLKEESKEPKDEQKDEKYVEMIEEGYKDKDLEAEKQEEAEERADPEGMVSDDKERYKAVTKKSMQSQPEEEQSQATEETANKKPGVCWGRTRVVTEHKKRFELVILIAMLILGLVIMVEGVIEMVSGDVET